MGMIVTGPIQSLNYSSPFEGNDLFFQRLRRGRRDGGCLIAHSKGEIIDTNHLSRRTRWGKHCSAFDGGT